MPVTFNRNLTTSSQGRRQDDALDQQLKDSFPASDASATY